MANASEHAAEIACTNLKKIIEAAENSNQAGENAAVMADAAPDMYRAIKAWAEHRSSVFHAQMMNLPLPPMEELDNVVDQLKAALAKAGAAP